MEATSLVSEAVLLSVHCQTTDTGPVVAWTVQVSWITSPSRTTEELLDKNTVMLLSEWEEKIQR